MKAADSLTNNDCVANTFCSLWETFITSSASLAVSLHSPVFLYNSGSTWDESHRGRSQLWACAQCCELWSGVAKTTQHWIRLKVHSSSTTYLITLSLSFSYKSRDNDVLSHSYSEKNHGLCEVSLSGFKSQIH